MCLGPELFDHRQIGIHLRELSLAQHVGHLRLNLPGRVTARHGAMRPVHHARKVAVENRSGLGVARQLAKRRVDRESLLLSGCSTRLRGLRDGAASMHRCGNVACR